MPHNLYLPRKVQDEISEHIKASIARAVGGFFSANEDEDTLTGHLGACLKTGVHVVDVIEDEINGRWKWSIDYAKFRGRGSNATESILGADGILELSIDMGYRQDKKSLLFQAKTEWDNSPDFVKQAILLSTWREAAIGINYTQSSYDSYSLDTIVASRGIKRNAKGAVPLQDVLTQYFLPCKIGNTDLRYDARTRRLYWRDINGLMIAVQFSIPKRITLKIDGPAARESRPVDKEVSLEEVHEHRMEVSHDEVLKPLLTPANFSPRSMKRSLAMAYHPDRFSAHEQLIRDLAKSRMQEVNVASDVVVKRESRR